MKPGPELDQLIAEKVMGMKTVAPPYSTDIAAAWEVVDAIRYKHGGGLLELYRNGDDTWAARFDEDARLTTCDTPAHAICLAALTAVGLNISNISSGT